MRRNNNLLPRILTRDNIRLAVAKALRGKRHRPDARLFTVGLESNVQRMIREVADGTFALGRSRQFIIHDPKQRTITAPCFEERVLHHAIMNICEPVFERWLIDDTYACRQGRGRDAAILRAGKFARESRFFLKMDVRKYFDSVPRTELLQRLARLFHDRALLDLLARILASFRTESDRGLPIGALTSQHFANFYLGWFDRFVKESLRVRGYVRYMDDMAIWADSRSELRRIRDRCREFLDIELQLVLKPVYLNRTSHGMDFLGCRVYQDRVTLNRRSRVRFRRSLLALEAAFENGWISELELQQRATSLIAFTEAAGARSWQFRRRVLEQLAVSGRMA